MSVVSLALCSLIAGQFSVLMDSIALQPVYNCWKPLTGLVYNVPTASIAITVVPTGTASCRVFNQSISAALNVSTFNETLSVSVDGFDYSTNQTLNFPCPEANADTLKRCKDALLNSFTASLSVYTVKYATDVNFVYVAGQREDVLSCYSDMLSLATLNYSNGTGSFTFSETGKCKHADALEVKDGTLSIWNSAGIITVQTTLKAPTPLPPLAPSKPTLTFSFNPVSESQLTSLLQAMQDPWAKTQLNYTVKINLTTNDKVEIPLSMNLTGIYSSVKATCFKSVSSTLFGDKVRIVAEGNGGTDCQVLLNGRLSFSCYLRDTTGEMKITMTNTTPFGFKFEGTQVIDFQCVNGDLISQTSLQRAFALGNMSHLLVILAITEYDSNGGLSFYYKQQVQNKVLACWVQSHISLSKTGICVYITPFASQTCIINGEYNLIYYLNLSLPNLGTFSKQSLFSLRNTSVCWTCENYETMQIESPKSCQSALQSFASSYKGTKRNRSNSTMTFTEAIFSAHYPITGSSTTMPIKRVVFTDNTATHITVTVISLAFAVAALVHIGFGLRRIQLENSKLRQIKKMYAQSKQE